MSNIQLPDDKTLAKKLVDSQTRLDERKAEMGWLGGMFDSGIDKAGNIAGLAIVCSFLLLVFVLLLSSYYPQIKTEVLIPVITGIITLALGYIFGKGERH